MFPKSKALGIVGFGILVGVLLYLILKVLGVLRSATAEEVLLAVVVGQIFYNGYIYRAVHDIEEQLKRIERAIIR